MKTMLHFSLLALMSFNGYLLYKNQKLNAMLTNTIEIVAKEKVVNASLKSQIRYLRDMENVQFADVVVETPFDNSCLISEIFASKTSVSLCLRFKDTHCDACIKDACALIKNVASEWQGEISVFTSYRHVAQFSALSNSFINKNITVYNVENFLWEIEGVDEPYFFVIQNGMVHEAFLYSKGTSNDNYEYLKNVVRKYKNGKQNNENKRNIS